MFNSDKIARAKRAKLLTNMQTCNAFVAVVIESPVYMEKSFPGQEGYSFSQVNFSERLYEKKVGFSMITVLAYALIVSP